jgi:chemosensory pili system protein ChpA (sensor histidine kinase/response regulator)
METLQAGRGDPWYMLDNAERCLLALDSMRTDLRARRCAPRRRQRRLRLRRHADAAERRQAVDPELLTLFIEEAGEEIATVGRLFPLWAENPADRESLARVRRAFHTLKGSGRVVGARRIGDFAWAVENLLNRVIDGTLERSSAMLATLREAIALLPSLVGELGGTSDEVAGLSELAARIESHTAGQAHPLQRQSLPPRRRSRRSCSRRLRPRSRPSAWKCCPSSPPEPEPPADDAWRGRPASYAEGGDSSLQEIYQKEVHSHLEVIRAYLRHAWLAVGTHTVTEDLYRACHTLRGASRTAASATASVSRSHFTNGCGACSTTTRPSTRRASLCLRIASSAFEDVIAAVHEGTGHFTNLDRLVRRIEQQDAALEQRLAEEPPQFADVAGHRSCAACAAAAPEAPPPEAPPRLSLEALLPGRGAGVRARARPARSCCRSCRLRPASRAGRLTWHPPSRRPPPRRPMSRRRPPRRNQRSDDYDPEVASIFSEEAHEASGGRGLGARRAQDVARRPRAA